LQNSKGQKSLSFALLYKFTLEKLLEIRKYMLKDFAKKFIEFSLIAFTAPILFTRKANKKLYFCVNYQRLNALIKKN